MRQSTGINLDVGDIPQTTPADPDGDPEALAKIVAHTLTRVADRIPGLRRISQRFEGTDSRSGVLADVAAAGYELYKRNPHECTELARRYVTALVEKRKETMAANPGPRRGKRRRGANANNHTPEV